PLHDGERDAGYSRLPYLVRETRRPLSTRRCLQREERASLHGLAMKGDIETFKLNVLRHPQSDEDINDFEDNERHDAVVDEHGTAANGLVHPLHCMALQQAMGAAIFADSKHAGEQGAGSSADRMHAEGIKRVIVTEHGLETRAAPVAHDA